MVAFLTQTTVCGFSLYQTLAYFLIYSCLGWCLEVVYAAVTTGRLVNRGFLNGPVCPIYGFGMVIVLYALTPLVDNTLLLYLGGVILPSALELVGGWALYKLYRTRWWDYSDYPFNIGGYICLEFCLLWGVGTLVVMRIVHPIIAGLVAMVPTLVGVILMCILYAVYATDVVATAIAASTLADTLDTMEKLGDSIHAVSDAMTELLGTTAMTADQKMDESRLQLKLAAAEARDNAPKLKPREAMAAIRARTDEAMETARRASETARLNAAEAANAAKLAAQGASERAAKRAAALLQLEELSAELQARSDEMRAQMLKKRHRPAPHAAGLPQAEARCEENFAGNAAQKTGSAGVRSGPGQQGISPVGCCGFVAIICDDPLFYRFFAAYSVHFCAIKIAGSYFQIAHLMLYCYIRA